MVIGSAFTSVYASGLANLPAPAANAAARHISARIDAGQICTVDLKRTPETLSRLARNQRDGTIAGADIKYARAIGEPGKKLRPNVAQFQGVVCIRASRAGRERAASIMRFPGRHSQSNRIRVMELHPRKGIDSSRDVDGQANPRDRALTPGS